jgi:hypothetical protein
MGKTERERAKIGQSADFESERERERERDGERAKIGGGDQI